MRSVFRGVRQAATRFGAMVLAVAIGWGAAGAQVISGDAKEPVSRDAFTSVIEILMKRPGCVAPLDDIVAAGAKRKLDRPTIEGGIQFMQRRMLISKTSEGYALMSEACPESTADAKARTLGMLRLTSCTASPAVLTEWLREYGLKGRDVLPALQALAAEGLIRVAGDDQYVATTGEGVLTCAKVVSSFVATEADVLRQAMQGGCAFSLESVVGHLAKRGLEAHYVDAVISALVDLPPDAGGKDYVLDLPTQSIRVSSAECNATYAVPTAWPEGRSPADRLVVALQANGCRLGADSADLQNAMEAQGISSREEAQGALMIAAARGDLVVDAAAGTIGLAEALCTAAAATAPEEAAAPAGGGDATQAALDYFRGLDGCASDPAALSQALGAEGEAAVGALMAAGDVTLVGGKLVLSEALCAAAPAADPVKGRAEAIAAFAAAGCSLAADEAEAALGPDAQAALEAMLAAGEVKLVFGRLAMEQAVCTETPAPAEKKASLGSSGGAEPKVAEAAPAAPAAPALATDPAEVKRILAGTPMDEQVRAITAALTAAGCGFIMTDATIYDTVYAATFLTELGIDPSAVSAPETRDIVVEAVRAAGREAQSRGLIFYDGITKWGGLTSCSKDRPVPTAAEATAYLTALDDAGVDRVFALVVEDMGCQLDFADTDVLTRLLLETTLLLLRQEGSTDARLREAVDAFVAKGVERAAPNLERVGNSSKFRLKGCKA